MGKPAETVVSQYFHGQGFVPGLTVAGSAVAGSGEGGMALVRYAPDGKLDPSFAKGGELLASGVPWADLALQRDGNSSRPAPGVGPKAAEKIRESSRSPAALRTASSIRASAEGASC